MSLGPEAAPNASPSDAERHFASRRVLLCALPLLVLMLWIVALSGLADRRRHRHRRVAGPHVGAGSGARRKAPASSCSR